MFVKVSQDYIEMIADMKYSVPLRDVNGEAKLETILSLLGFNCDVSGRVQYEILNPVEGTIVRNPKKPFEVMTMRVYCGNVRNDYPFKGIYKDKDILIGNFTHGEDLKQVTDVEQVNSKGESYYNKSVYTPIEYVVLHTDVTGQSDDEGY